MKPSHTRALAAALLAAAVTACGTPARGAAQGAPPMSTTGANHPITEADVRFMSAMIGHHAQAIEMSRLAPTRAASPQVRVLAERIINAQVDEIAAMQQWLRDHGKPVPEPAAAMAHHHAGGGHGAPMAGMLTGAQMKELEEARGADFDRLFLTYMIQHHRGAMSMAAELFGTHGAGQDDTVFKLASDINVDQATEVARMQRMLADLLFGSVSQ